MYILGMTADEIAAIRTTFRTRVDETEALLSRNPGEDMIAFRGRAEDVWMASQGPYSEFALNLPQVRAQG
jgi:hypothetical protein